MKVMAVRLLQSRLGMGDAPETLRQEFQTMDSWPHLETAFGEVWELKLPELQRRVRMHFTYISGERLSESMRDMEAMLVKPLLAMPIHVGTAACLKETRQLAVRLHAGDLASVSETSLKLASKASAGVLDQHPLAQGLLLACMERAERDSRGIPTMRKFSALSTRIGSTRRPACP